MNAGANNGQDEDCNQGENCDSSIKSKSQQQQQLKISKMLQLKMNNTSIVQHRLYI